MTITAQLADGTKLEFPDGTDPAVIARVAKQITMQGKGAATKPPTISPEQRAANVAANADRQAGINQTAKDNMVLDSIGWAASGVTKFAQGLPFVGQYTDEFTGALGNAVGAVTGDKGLGDRAMTQQRAVQDAMDRKYPKTSMGLMLGGGVAGSAPLAAIAVPKILAQSTTLLGRTILSALTGASAGGVEGAISGSGAANDGNRTQGAISGGVAGAAAGGLFGGLAPGLASGGKAAIEWLKRTDVAIIAKELGVSKPAAKYLRTSIEALDPASASRNLKTAGPDAMIADAGLPTRRALDAAITGGGKGARIGVDAVSDRAAAAGTKLSRVMDAVLGAPEGIKTATRSIATRTAPAREKAYKLAFDTPIDYAADTGRAVEGVLARIPDKTLSSAISEANDAMRAAGTRNKQILADIAADGSVTFKEMPNVQQLNEIKIALQTIAQNETDDITGKITAAGRRAKDLARDLKGAIGDAVPAYGAAVKLGGDKIAEENALNMGRKIFGTGVTREMVREEMKGASIESADAARKGIRGYIDDTLARVRRSIDDPEADTPETLRLLNTLSSRDARDKITMVLGQSKADRLFKEIDAAGKQYGTRMAIAKGSDTAQRKAQEQVLDASLAPGFIGNLGKGSPVKSVQSLMQMLTRTTDEATSEQRQKILAEVATALTEKRGPQAEAALKAVQDAIAGQPISSANAARIANLVVGGASLTGYQTGQRSLEPQVRKMLPQ